MKSDGFGISFPRLPVDSSSSSPLLFVHLIVLVHGWMGSPLELDYLKQTLLRQAQQQQQQQQQQEEQHVVLVHAAQSNNGQTMDGIANGGHRLAREINEWIQSIQNQIEDEATTANSKAEQGHKTRISLSIVGNSLGGLYARYALSEIFMFQNNPNSTTTNQVIPALFVTTATPHLGVAAPHTYISLPNWLEYTVARIIGTTGLDLFRIQHHHNPNNNASSKQPQMDILQQMTVDPKFTNPLRQFQYRIAYANAHYTDFQVPCSTAAFLSNNNTESIHHLYPIDNQEFQYVTLAVTTTTHTNDTGHTKNDDESQQQQQQQQQCPIQNEPQQCLDLPLSSDALAWHLDRMGWIKIFCDVRETLPQLIWPWRNRNNSHSNHASTNYKKHDIKPSYTSMELWESYAKFNPSRIHLPLGHTMLVANAKNEFYRRINAPGQPVMDDLAKWMLQHLFNYQQPLLKQSPNIG
jgi:hypothetical protein